MIIIIYVFILVFLLAIISGVFIFDYECRYSQIVLSVTKAIFQW